MYEAARGRKPGVVILDPIERVVYRRSRRGKIREALDLQNLLEDKGLPALRRFAHRNYGGYIVAVVP